MTHEETARAVACSEKVQPIVLVLRVTQRMLIVRQTRTQRNADSLRGARTCDLHQEMAAHPARAELKAHREAAGPY